MENWSNLLCRKISLHLFIGRWNTNEGVDKWLLFNVFSNLSAILLRAQVTFKWHNPCCLAEKQQVLYCMVFPVVLILQHETIDILLHISLSNRKIYIVFICSIASYIFTSHRMLVWTIDNEVGICCSSAKHTALSIKSKYLMAPNQDNVSEWSDMYARGLLFQWVTST